MLLRRDATPSALALELAEAALRRSAQGIARRAARWTPLRLLRAERLVQPIPPLVKGNPALAAEIYRGRFHLAGTLVDAQNRIVFELAPPTEAFAASLHGFGWLMHLEAASRELPRVQARGLVGDWMGMSARHHPVARRLDVASRRLIAWIQHGPFLLHNADAGFHEAFMASLGRQATQLMNAIRLAPSGRNRLDAAIALAYAATALGGLESVRANLLERLSRELEQQILPDGGHISRNPAVLVELLLDLLPLRDAIERTSCELPHGLVAAIERMLPLLRFFLHGDGGLAGFNGVTDRMAGAARAIVDADAVHGRPITLAPHVGYARLGHGRATVIADIGRPPAIGLNPGAQAGPLAFEFSDGPHRIVVNCGNSRLIDPRWAAASRCTAAHSTAILGERSSCLVVANRVTEKLFGSPLLFGPRTVEGALQSHPGGTILEARHDGYAAAYGYGHERRLYLASDGADLRGEDRFAPSPDGRTTDPETGFAVRFHLHPSVKVTMARDGASVVLLLPNRTGWRFCARGARLEVADSVYLLGQAAPRRTRQIVLTGTVGAEGTAVKWAFKRIERRSVPNEYIAPPRELPLEPGR